MHKLLLLSSFLLVFGSCSTYQGPGQIKAPVYKTERAQLPEPRFRWPVQKARMTRGFDPEGRNHYGIDLANRTGTPIYAAHSGHVIYANNGFRGYGRLIIVEHPSGWASLYAHLSRYNVKEGDWIEKGSLIGKMGATGRVTGPHLHFELRQDKRAVDPLNYLP